MLPLFKFMYGKCMFIYICNMGVKYHLGRFNINFEIFCFESSFFDIGWWILITGVSYITAKCVPFQYHFYCCCGYINNFAYICLNLVVAHVWFSLLSLITANLSAMFATKQLF